ncbi:MAG: long-chain fatty acid--CoA ligase [Rickettsiales bacterium]|nr:long-chain fatty acid--CoA ligase [Rickettsiales bacterium]
MKTFSTLSEIVAFQDFNFTNPQAFNFREKGQLRSFSNQEFRENIFHFACGLREIGLGKNDNLAICSYQNPIWLMADFGAILAGAVTVPIFHNISKENLLFEIADANVKFVFCDSLEFFESVKNLGLKIITYGFEASGSDHFTFESLIQLGKKAADAKKYNFEELLKIAQPQDIATIIYTSGSTGRPKGVELTHLNLVSQVQATAEFFTLTAKDVALSFLPLAHIFERMVMMFYISRGISVYFTDDVKNVGGALKETRPTLLTTVPRVLEKVFAKIESGTEAASGFKKFLGTKALKRALEKNPNSPKNIFDKIFDALVYKKFRVAMGGNIRMIICGGSALSEVLECFYKNIGIDLFCGYGMTETSPVIAANCYKGNKIGTVGKAFPQVELKIAQDGELLVRGPNLMRGYHNQPEKTAEIIENGWLKTGDLAKIDEEGFVKIVGRKKELFKNANGKYVSPVPIEQKLMQNLPFLIGAIVIAEGKKFTAAILFPEFEMLKKTKEQFEFVGSDEEFLQSEKLQNFVQKEIAEINQDLNHWEQVQKFHIARQPISIESGDITPSMKLKRNVLEAKFAEVVEVFYKEV